jgi:AcrR family transcriptional regulator
MAIVEKSSRRASGTRERIMEAALATVREKGFAGTTARAIAQHGGFNQSLIFYHFGSVPDLVLEAFSRDSVAQLARHRDAAAATSSLSDLVVVARRLHTENLERGSVKAVTQLMAAAASDPDLGRAILDAFEDWIALVQDTLSRVAVSHSLAGTVPARQVAYAISAMFLGIELITRLDPERSEAEAVFDVMADVARLIEARSSGF